MKNKWGRLGIGIGAVAIIAGLSFGAMMNVQAQDAQGSAVSQGSAIAQAHGPRGGMGMFGSQAAIAKALGISESDLMTALKSGKTVADVATEKGVALSTVVDAVVAEQTTTLAKAVTDGKLTQAQADERIAKLKTDLPTMLSTKQPEHPQVGGPRGSGMGMFGAPATIATALGISESDLMTALKSGKTVADVATEKGIALSKVVDAVVAEQTTALAKAVTDGKITQAQADERLAKLKTDLPTMLSTKQPEHPQVGGPRGGMGMFGSQATIATALGVSESDLMTALKSGKTVADVATEKGIALSKVVDAVVAEQTTALAKAVTDGKITQAQADERIAKLKTDLPTILSTKHTAGDMGPGHRMGGRGNGQAAPQNPQSPLAPDGTDQSSNPSPLVEPSQSA
ncbi:MAG: hypothetical protein NT075_32460 [Chloroflexi bacterium]|nr:hypothetical protein [Chloroflexota bacterium]